MSSPVFTSEELRVVAMNSSSRRGKSVARRRLIWRWFAWIVWSVLLPLIGLTTTVALLAGLAAREYLGHDLAYSSAQTWVQAQFGPFKKTTTTQTNPSASTPINSSANPVPNQLPNPPVNPISNQSSNRSDNAIMIPLTSEATPDLQLDRHLTIKTKPKVAVNRNKQPDLKQSDLKQPDVTKP
jgi:predicted anti-sigma-YlaC factor YlaD